MHLKRIIPWMPCLLAPGIGMAATLHVPSEYGTIQAALDATAIGDTVLVEAGVFTGPGNRDLNFGGKDLVLRGAGAGSTILDCEGSPAAPRRGIDFRSGESPDAVVDGVTIRNGYSANWSGGINCRDASPTIRNTVIEDCVAATFGGGIGAWAGSVVSIEACVLRMNSAGTDGGGIGVTGGATVFVSDTELQLNQCGVRGGGIDVDLGQLFVTGSSIEDNHASSSGGGISGWQHVTEVRSSRISGNYASASGGGLILEVGHHELDDVVISGNHAGYRGGGVAFANSETGQTTRTTISGNSAVASGGGAYLTRSPITIETTIFFDNCSPVGPEIYAAEDPDGPIDVVLSCCAVDPSGIEGPGSITFENGLVVVEDPLFCEPLSCLAAPTTDGDFTLRDDSPCLPANNPCGVLIGALPEGCAAASAPEVLAGAGVSWIRPSPARPGDSLQLRLLAGDRRVDLYDSAGRHLAVLHDSPSSSDERTVTVSLGSVIGASGVYFVRAASDEGVRAARLVVAE